MAFHIGLVPCGAAKKKQACPARDMYIGTFFYYCRMFVNVKCSDWLITSSKYGPCFPERIIEPYDYYIGHEPLAVQKAWFEQYYPDPFLSMILRKASDSNNDVTIWSFLPMAFGRYLIPALKHQGFRVEEPVKGQSCYRRIKVVKELALRVTGFGFV